MGSVKRVKATVKVESPIEVTVDIPKDKMNREGIITYLKDTMEQVIIDKYKIEFEVLE